MTELKIPEFSLVVLVGVTGSGKTTFARKHFEDAETLSLDRSQPFSCGDEGSQAQSGDSFKLLHKAVSRRLKQGMLTVVDAANIDSDSRVALVRLAKKYYYTSIVIVLDLPGRTCKTHNASRTDRVVSSFVIYRQRMQLRRSLRRIKHEGFKYVYFLRSIKTINAVRHIVREKLPSNKREVRGPFDIIGDVHGCFTELVELLQKMDYVITRTNGDGADYGFDVTPPEGRTALFLGDLVDRGPDSPSVLRLVMSMVKQGVAYCVPGNHDFKLHKYLAGSDIKVKHGLEKTLEQLRGENPQFLGEVDHFIAGLASHYVFDDGRLVIAHAGLEEAMHGRGGGTVRSYCLYGETTGETDEFGLPVRVNWALNYRGKAMVVYGHTPVLQAQWVNNTIDIDTGCVFGGSLTALRYPEKELVTVKARQVYHVRGRPMGFQVGA